MRNGYLIDTLTSVNIQEVFIKRDKVIEIYEGVISRESFILSPFREVFDEIFLII